MRDKTPNLTDYEKTYQEFKWEIPEYYNFGFDGIDRWAEDRTKLALISVDDTGVHAVRRTFYDLMRLSNQFANVLFKMGIKKGDRVLLMLPRIPEWYVAMIGQEPLNGSMKGGFYIGLKGVGRILLKIALTSGAELRTFSISIH